MDCQEDNHTKTPVSDAKRAANQANSQLSTGPISPAGKKCVRMNAIKHGLRGRALRFQDEQEKADFEKLIHDLEAEHSPVGILEREMVKEIAVCIWKIAIGDSWLMEVISARRETGTSLLDFLARSSKDVGNPFAKRSQKFRRAAQASWDCRELIVSVGGEDVNPYESSRMQFQARLVGSGDAILRYQSAWKRDLHRAIETLTNLQQPRKSSVKGDVQVSAEQSQ